MCVADFLSIRRSARRTLEHVFEHFSDAARRVVVCAQDEARLLDHDYVGTEHLLLGLVREGDPVVSGLFDRFGPTLDAARAEVARVVGRGAESESGYIAFTEHAKVVLERAWLAASHGDTTSVSVVDAGRGIGQWLHRVRATTIVPAHLLLGLIAEHDGVAVGILDGLGVDLTALRQGALDAVRDVRHQD